MRRFTPLLLILTLTASVCGSGSDQGAEPIQATTAEALTTTTTTAEALTTTTTTAEALTTTTTTPSTTTSDLDEWEKQGIEAAEGFAASLRAKDATEFVSYFAPLARIIDPIYPALYLGPASYASYMFDLAGEEEPLGVIHVNRNGAAEQFIAGGFLTGLEPPTEEPMVMLRHLTLEDSKIFRLVHYFEYEAAVRHPEAVVTVVGFPAGAAKLITDTGTDAHQLFNRYFDAWSSADPDAIVALYDKGATRTDALLGSVAAAELEVFVSDLLEDWPGLSLEPGLTYINGWGCAAAYTIDADGCKMSAISVFELTEAGTIAGESVYYAPALARQCEWGNA